MHYKIQIVICISAIIITSKMHIIITSVIYNVNTNKHIDMSMLCVESYT